LKNDNTEAIKIWNIDKELDFSYNGEDDDYTHLAEKKKSKSDTLYTCQLSLKRKSNKV